MAPTTTSAAKPNKSDFIRKQPATMSAAEVVKKAKAQGLDLRAGLVYEVRRMAKVKTGGAPKKTPGVKKVAPKAIPLVPKTVTSKKQPPVSKASFVRAHSSLSPKEIVAKAKAEGMKLDVGYVYNVRGAAKAGARKKVVKQAARRATVTVGASLPRPVASGSPAESLLRAVAAEIGLGRAMEILTGERTKVQALFGA
jgi:hypothetical protein